MALNVRGLAVIEHIQLPASAMANAQQQQVPKSIMLAAMVAGNYCMLPGEYVLVTPER